MAVSTGTRIGRYQVIELVGAGGMGEVYRARDDRLQRDVALKILPEQGDTSVATRRFETEARAIAALSHPNIVNIYDYGAEGGQSYIAMELLEGETLRSPRGLAAMWYDPNLKKTVMYGGLGRQSAQDRLERFGDMWTFDGTGWSALKPAGATPGQRYGAQVTVDPRTNHVILFGGLRLDINDLVQTQVYADDTWEWDGTAWTKLAPGTVPPARENASLTFDPVRGELVMFGGYAGHYFSDTWGFNAGNWHQRIENTQRRRSARR